jgi:hypothetical protein
MAERSSVSAEALVLRNARKREVRMGMIRAGFEMNTGV